ncbi:hypothetical protein L3Q82_022473 [Scortum barcoo]|uniref:Uncharacterized protein n=1 Tax=Scortum barcoo TaxID=214431 RepID=A0ACB8X1R4_9TELE|nr:hypothetical protein L3Q82_022473 [Scortum barcoo]
MEEDYRSGLLRNLRRGKQYSANTVYSAGGELLTSSGDIIGRWKKYFEDLLNPTDLPSTEEAEAGDSSITEAEVTEVVHANFWWQGAWGWMRSALIPEYLKSLDVVRGFSQEQSGMALQKQIIKDAGDSPSGSQGVNENTQEDEALDNNDELSSSLLLPTSSREKRKRERENRSRPKEMTEEEMMDLALRLSEQEATITALRLQKEEEAVMKAIHESMVGQTQPCPPSQSQNPLADPETSLRLCSRRKLLYPNRKTTSTIDKAASGVGCTPETDLNRGESLNTADSVMLLDILQFYSSDSTQIGDCQLRKSPVFPLTGCRAEVHVPRLSQDLLQTCRTSGFVLCSQDSCTSPQKCPPAQPKSSTFPKSPKHSGDATLSKSPVFSETDQGDDGETELSPECFRSPVFGRNTQHEKSPSACKPQVGVCISGFMFSSQESLTSSVRSTSCRPQSPVFPSSPLKNPPPSERACRSPVFSETDGGQTEPGNVRSKSPVFGRKRAANPSAAELRGSGSDGNSAATSTLRQDSETDHNEDVRFNRSSKSDDAEEELNEISKDQNSAEAELTTDMTLIWSDEDDDVTPVGSPSPVFPEERSAHQADLLNHETAASSGTTASNCRPSSSSTSTGRQPISSQGTVSGSSVPSGAPAGGQTVHYYWGVPFCPRGLDPDNYTQVILAQMEVYEKSLKQAQRCLLRKAEWGEAILPQPEVSDSTSGLANQGCLRVSGSLPNQSTCALWIWRRHSTVSLVVFCGECSAEYGVWGPLLRGCFGLCTTGAGAWFTLPAVSQRGLRLKGAADASPAEGEEGEDQREEEGEEEEERGSKGEERKMEGEEGGQVDTDDCEVCPETQLSDDDRTQDLMMMDTDSAAELRPKSPERPEVDEMILQDDSPAGNEPQEEEEEEMEVDMEDDAPVDRKTKENIPVNSSDVGGQTVRGQEAEVDTGDPDVEEIKDRELQRSTSPELEPAGIPQGPETTVDCPICQGSFPATKIEMHAAYCDGEVAVVDERRPEANCFQVSLKPRRKRTRRLEETDEETNDLSNTGKNQEKCYICQKAFPLKDYSRHTQFCIQQQTSKTAAVSLSTHSKGNLLSALQQTESRDSGESEKAGPSGSKLQSGDVIDLLDDDDEVESGGVSAVSISNSPIRAFTPISEATGCLIDFKKQRTKKLSQRRR